MVVVAVVVPLRCLDSQSSYEHPWSMHCHTNAKLYESFANGSVRTGLDLYLNIYQCSVRCKSDSNMDQRSLEGGDDPARIVVDDWNGSIFVCSVFQARMMARAALRVPVSFPNCSFLIFDLQVGTNQRRMEESREQSART